MDMVTFLIDVEMFFRIVLACLLGGLIGWERERHRSSNSAGNRNIVSAGIRTYGAISLGSCAFGILSYHLPAGDPTRIAAQVVTGIGFLGGGIIFRQGDYITGLTTAATLWATAAVGLAVSFGLYFVSTFTAILIYLLLYLPRMGWWKKISAKYKND
ncbi:MAG TPA: MgtC/SapB family protein [Gammaproteobacteria bacterium]|jgi:putative Mg2+ transporter-C (MgtC) family protein|nr:MgtC/SapB family protein [Gammaproteobacteria bacterium]